MKKEGIDYRPTHRMITDTEKMLFKEKRLKLGIERKAIEERLGLRAYYISSMENKGGKFPIWILDKLSQIYKIKGK